MIKKYLHIIFALTVSLSYAQVDTAVYADTIYIETSSIQHHATGSVSKDFVHAAVTLSDQLSDSGAGFVKNYGLGSLSTSSVRGGSASHTLVLWNGLPIQNPMLGLLDYSLIPSQLGEKISIELGGNSSLWGGGAVAASIKIDNTQPKVSSIAISNSYGSFNTWHNTAALRYADKNVQSSSKYIRESSDRDYPYTLSNGVEKSLTNGKYDRHHLLQDLYVKMDDNNSLSAHIWGYSAETQIPNTTVQNISSAHQKDYALRSQIKWKNVSDSRVFNVRAGYFNEHIDYYDPAIRLEAFNEFYTLFGDVRSEWQIANTTILAGLTHSHTKATTKGYKGSEIQDKTALFGSYQYAKNRFSIQGSVRAELVDSELIPVVSHLGIHYDLAKEFAIKSKISRNYRLPTLNDKHWKPGGNPAIQPEQGWSEEISFIYHKNSTPLDLNARLTAYNRTIKDWILWAPNKALGTWSATNLDNVWSRGLESSFEIAYKNNDYRIQTNAQYSLTKSTSQTNHNLPKITRGDQLTYTPEHTWNTAVTFAYGSQSISYRHRYSSSLRGVRFVIPAFSEGNLSVSKKIRWSRVDTELRLDINNLWDRQNYIIEYRPMPKRHYNFTFSLKY